MGVNPNWQPFLDVLPESLHGDVTPILEQWDKGVQEKITGLHQKYEPYKDLVENEELDRDDIDRALWLAGRLEEDPKELINEINDTFQLGLTVAEKQQLEEELTSETTNLNNSDGEEVMPVDLSSSPEFKAMQETLEKMSGYFETQQAQTEAQKQQQEVDNQLNSLKEVHGDFNEMFVLALMSQGIEGEAAVKTYQDTINQAAAQIAGNPASEEEGLVVLGGNGQQGSGVPDGSVRMGDLSSKDVTSAVADFLKNANTN